MDSILLVLSPGQLAVKRELLRFGVAPLVLNGSTFLPVKYVEV